MFKTSMLAAAAVLALSAPAAGAACLDQIAQLEQRLNRIESADAQQQQQQATGGGDTVEMEMASGEEVEVTVESAEGGTQPQENWFGSPPSREGAEEQLDNAREMAEAGDEQGCMEHAEQAAQIVTTLEEQQQ
jgi:hypothetical protein